MREMYKCRALAPCDFLGKYLRFGSHWHSHRYMKGEIVLLSCHSCFPSPCVSNWCNDETSLCYYFIKYLIFSMNLLEMFSEIYKIWQVEIWHHKAIETLLSLSIIRICEQLYLLLNIQNFSELWLILFYLKSTLVFLFTTGVKSKIIWSFRF